MTSSELVAALEEGKLLEKDYSRVDETQYEKGECIQYLFRNEERGSVWYENKGWDSAVHVHNILVELLERPQYWTVSKHNIQDFPWRKR